MTMFTTNLVLRTLVIPLVLLCGAHANYVIFGGTPTVVRTRLDPIVNSGMVRIRVVLLLVLAVDPDDVQVGGHVHDVFGGSGFTETYDYNKSIQSNCTTMPIPQDFSNYWVVRELQCSQKDRAKVTELV